MLILWYREYLLPDKASDHIRECVYVYVCMYVLSAVYISLCTLGSWDSVLHHFVRDFYLRDSQIRAYTGNKLKNPWIFEKGCPVPEVCEQVFTVKEF